MLTTAEAIAAELRREQENRPPRVCHLRARLRHRWGALPLGRRRGGANLAVFRSMAGGLFGRLSAARQLRQRGQPGSRRRGAAQDMGAQLHGLPAGRLGGGGFRWAPATLRPAVPATPRLNRKSSPTGCCRER